MFVAFRINVHQDNIPADLADAFPGDHILAIVAEETKAAGAGNDNSGDTAGLAVEFQVTDIAKAAAVFNIDHFFVAQVRKAHAQTPKYVLLLWYEVRPEVQQSVVVLLMLVCGNIEADFEAFL